MISPSMQHIPLKFAYLCQDCNSVGNSSRQCPACASEVLMGLAGVLDREAGQQPKTAFARSSYPQLTAMVA